MSYIIHVQRSERNSPVPPDQVTSCGRHCTTEVLEVARQGQSFFPLSTTSKDDVRGVDRQLGVGDSCEKRDQGGNSDLHRWEWEEAVNCEER